jgi:hypothetical protein
MHTHSRYLTPHAYVHACMQVQKGKSFYITQRRADGDFADPFEESRRYMASLTPERAGGAAGTPGSGAGHHLASPHLTHHHYHQGAATPHAHGEMRSSHPLL